MELISVNHSLNETYFVEVKAIEQVVKKSVSILKGYKLNSVEIKLQNDNKEVKVRIDVTFPANTTFSEGTLKVKNSVEEYVSNLIDTKPNNIEIKVNK